MKLYWAPNTISIAPALVLNEGGVHWEPVRVDFASGEQTGDAYLAVNPKGRVPALATPGGVLTEAGAIMEYLAATAVPGMVPADPFHAARMREVMYYLASTMHVNHAHKVRGARWADRPESWDDMKAKVPQTMAASAAYVEGLFEDGPLLFGDAPTLADAYLYVVGHWLPADGVEVGDYPRLVRFMEVMRARPAVQALWDKGMLK
ncbi:glutathione S-transferase [Alphaproteobacteria bacterium GH1-50]|uniref:Glutathione S-transferase n=1 Tax=Kangsaoukella pontilimi TaxID=2691042 RepID=A0A7C9MFF5_9RHOB|nr:glutathione S-transferase family protein [Kangsaoukella pontilimi]MXQ09511.1 glutathione S-transferase [Kangsaoukella pontilimi]